MENAGERGACHRNVQMLSVRPARHNISDVMCQLAVPTTSSALREFASPRPRTTGQLQPTAADSTCAAFPLSPPQYHFNPLSDYDLFANIKRTERLICVQRSATFVETPTTVQRARCSVPAFKR